MMTKIIHFIKYHNAFTFSFVLVFVFGAAAFASETVRNATLGQEIVTKQGIDNTALLAVDLNSFNFGMRITNVLEDEENYRVEYQYNTLAIQNQIWQQVTQTGTLTVSKAGLVGQDLGLFVAGELSEIVDSELAYLREVQGVEKQKGQTFIQQTVRYTALLGLVLDPETRTLPGYVPVIQPPEPAFAISADSEISGKPTSAEQEVVPDEVTQQPTALGLIDKKIIRQMILEILAQEQKSLTPEPTPMVPNSASPPTTPTPALP